MVGMTLSSIMGLVTTMLVSRAFGTSADLDAFYAANRLTEIIFNLMAGGALASAFIPTFTEFLTRKDHAGGWRLASSVANLVLLALSIVAVLATILAPWLVTNILAPGFEDPAQIDLTVQLLRIMLISAVIFGISGLFMGILNAHQHFALPSIAPAFYRLGWMLGIWFQSGSSFVLEGLAYSEIAPVNPIMVLSFAGGLSSSAIPHPMNAVGINTAANHPKRVASNIGPDAALDFCACLPTVAPAAAADSLVPPTAAPSVAPMLDMNALALSFRAARLAALSSFVTTWRTFAEVDSRRKLFLMLFVYLQ